MPLLALWLYVDAFCLDLVGKKDPKLSFSIFGNFWPEHSLIFSPFIKMIPPPERSFKREANAAHASLSTLQKVVRYAEKDDLLLYMTAAFGVLMPGLMYFFYRYVHNRYQQKKRAQKQRKKQSGKSRNATIFYCSDVPATKNIAYELAENLQYDPLVAKLGPQEMEKARHSKVISREESNQFRKAICQLKALKCSLKSGFSNCFEILKHFVNKRLFLTQSENEAYYTQRPITFKGMQFHIFVLAKDTTNQREPGQCHLEEFADWLDELKYERREKNYLRETRFLIISPESNEETDQAILSFEKRLNSLGSIALGSVQIVDIKNNLQELCTQLNDLLRRFNYGEFDDPAGGMADDDSMEEFSEDEGSE